MLNQYGEWYVVDDNTDPDIDAVRRCVKNGMTYKEAFHHVAMAHYGHRQDGVHVIGVKKCLARYFGRLGGMANIKKYKMVDTLVAGLCVRFKCSKKRVVENKLQLLLTI